MSAESKIQNKAGNAIGNLHILKSKFNEITQLLETHRNTNEMNSFRERNDMNIQIFKKEIPDLFTQIISKTEFVLKNL